MKWLAGTVLVGVVAGWCVSRFAPDGVSTVAGIAVVVCVCAVPSGAWGRRVLWARADGPPAAGRR